MLLCNDSAFYHFASVNSPPLLHSSTTSPLTSGEKGDRPEVSPRDCRAPAGTDLGSVPEIPSPRPKDRQGLTLGLSQRSLLTRNYKKFLVYEYRFRQISTRFLNVTAPFVLFWRK